MPLPCTTEVLPFFLRSIAAFRKGTLKPLSAIISTKLSLNEKFSGRGILEVEETFLQSSSKSAIS